MAWQQTLRHSIAIDGIGLHSGESARIVLSPAAVGAGIVFQRKMRGQTIAIPATIDHLSSTELATTLSVGNAFSVGTIEHLLASLVSAGIDNCIVTVDQPEIPIADGSACAFVEAIAEAGAKAQAQRRRQIRITRPIALSLGESSIAIEPWHTFAIDLTVDFEHPYFSGGAQQLFVDDVYNNFATELAAARTFAFRDDIANMRQRGLALGGSLDNAIVIDGKSIVNPGGLRYPDELIRHKMLDIVGDLYLTGHRLIGKVTAFKSGHRLNCRLVRTIVDNPQCWEIVCGGYASAEKIECLGLIA